jgi:Skp family chaperone for outer membrane proteins
VQTAQAEIDAGAAVLSAGALAQRKAELDRLTRETQFKQEQAQADVQALNDTLMEEFQQKVQPIIEQVRSEKNLWVIFSTVDAGVAAMNPALDLSQEVIKRLDAATK